MNNVRHILCTILLTLLTGCGGGGGGSDSPAVVTTVSGVASKGILKKGGTVSVYPVTAAGVRGSTPLAVGNILNDSGDYSVNIGSYSGPIVVEISGTYTDEATGVPLSIPASAPLHAALGYVIPGKSFSLPVTPLTDLAYRQAAQAGPLTSTSIRDANDLVSYIMRIDIINTRPAAPTVAAFASATQSQKDYSLILAAVSQMMATNGKTLEATLTELNSGFANTATATALNSALATYLNPNNSNNTTGVTTIPTTLQNVGTVGNKYLLQLSGENLSSLQALSTTLTLPGNLLLRTDETGAPLASVFKLAGAAATTQNISLSASYTAASGSKPATILLTLLAPSGGLTAGDIIAITCDTSSGGTPPDATSIILSGTGLWDKDGAPMTGPGLSMR